MGRLDDLLVLLQLNLKRGSLTYEALDTVVVCAALQYNLSLDDALYVTFTGLRAKYNDQIIKNVIKKGRGRVESANLHLVNNYGADPTPLKEEANRYADLLESWFDPRTGVPMNNEQPNSSSWYIIGREEPGTFTEAPRNLAFGSLREARARFKIAFIVSCMCHLRYFVNTALKPEL